MHLRLNSLDVLSYNTQYRIHHDYFDSHLVVNPRLLTLEVANVRLNLFNHVLALFRAKFACNSTIRNPIFRWESCRGSM